LPAHLNDLSHSLQPIRAVILDYGDVISQSPDPSFITAMAGVFDLPEDQFRHLYAAMRHGYDRGDLNAKEYWARIAQAAEVELSAEQIGDLRRIDVAMWSNLHPAMLRWAAELRSAGVRTAVLSNMHDDMVQQLRSDATWETSFDCLMLSSEIRMAKPDAEIFWHCLQCLGVAPQEALFIDDREPNVQAAQALGIRGILFNSLAQLRVQLYAIGFKPLPK
jgi:putative hydrolase of the HAD superfamily